MLFDQDFRDFGSQHSPLNVLVSINVHVNIAYNAYERMTINNKEHQECVCTILFVAFLFSTSTNQVVPMTMLTHYTQNMLKCNDIMTYKPAHNIMNLLSITMNMHEYNIKAAAIKNSYKSNSLQIKCTCYSTPKNKYKVLPNRYARHMRCQK